MDKKIICNDLCSGGYNAGFVLCAEHIRVILHENDTIPIFRAESVVYMLYDNDPHLAVSVMLSIICVSKSNRVSP